MLLPFADFFFGLPGAGLTGANLFGFRAPLGIEGACFFPKDGGGPGLGGALPFCGAAFGCKNKEENFTDCII